MSGLRLIIVNLFLLCYQDVTRSDVTATKPTIEPSKFNNKENHLKIAFMLASPKLFNIFSIETTFKPRLCVLTSFYINYNQFYNETRFVCKNHEGFR